MLIPGSYVLYSAEDFRQVLQEKRPLARTKLARRFDRKACEALHTIKVNCTIRSQFKATF